MKKYLLLTMLSATLSMSGQLSLTDNALLRHQRLEQNGLLNATSPMKSAPAANRLHTSLAFIKLSPGVSADFLADEGVTVNSVRGDIALVAIPTHDVERIASLEGVERLELSKTLRPYMDMARESTGVDKIHAGTGLSHPYTGAGVITGIVDQGLDPNHINFRNDDGSSRIGYLAHIYIDSKSQDGWTGDQYDRNNIWRFDTDTDETFHGTHTLGILAGSYKGKVNGATSVNTQIAEIAEIDNPYYGVAYGADIAASCGDLQDMLIATGIDRILDYRYAEQKPCVLSLSLGSNTGVHNSKALMCQFLDLAAKECIVVLSAGNEGNIPLALNKTLDESKEAKTFILPTYSPQIRYGQVYVYSDKEFSLKAVIYNKARGRISYNMPIVDGQTQATPQYYCSSSFKEDDSDIVSSTFQTAFEGYVGLGWDIDTYSGQYIDTYSGQYMALIDYYTSDNTTSNANGNYILGYVVTGEPGQRIECYCDGIYTCLDDYNIDGWDTGSTDGTISDMACGNDVLVVGSYNTRDSYPAIDGYMYNYGEFTPGKVTPFSSYGTLSDGRTLPHVCAPGAAVISSTSTQYVENISNNVGKSAINATVTEADGRTNYWCPAAGTSMSAPFVAGTIALWLEANPELDINDVKSIIASTSTRDEDVLAGNPVQWGAGKFNAYEGLKEAIRLSNGITDVTVKDNALIVNTADNRIFEVFIGGVSSIDAVLYNLAGEAVAKTHTDCDEATIDASGLTPGIYIVNVNNIHSKRIIVK